MRHLRTAVLAALFVAAGTTVFSQNAQTILRYDDPAVSLLRSIYLEQGKEQLSTAGPFSIGEIRMMMDKIDPSTLSPAGMIAYKKIMAEIATKPAPKPMALSLAAEPAASIEGYYHTNQDPAQTVWQHGYDDRLPLFTIPLQFWLGDNAYAAVDLAMRQNPDGVNASIVPDNPFNWTLDFDVLDFEIPQRAFAAIGGDDWSLSIGRDRFEWGNGQSGNLLLSDSPDYEDFARLTLYWPSVKYTAIWVMLLYDLGNYRSPIWGSAGGNTTAYDQYPRNFFIHRLDFSLFDRLSLSINEGILIGGVEPDLVYFNPLIIFHDLFRWGNASSVLTLEADYNPWKYFELYGQASYNQIQTLYELLRYGTAAADSPGAAAYLGGLRARIPLWQGYVDAGGEAVQVQPYMYLRENQLISFEWWRWTNSNVSGSPQWISAPLGYFTGPDAIVYSCWASYDVPDLFMVGVDFQNIAQGQNNFNTTYTEDATAAALAAPSGIPQYSNILHLRGSVDPFPFLRFATDLYWIWCDNFGHVSGVQTFDFQASASATVHFSL